ncbi:HupE/UreJ family protein [Thiohalomonas denitrificans]|uniref:HupE / UreJ protein n=1 Tax=Thiohalomonas denitrificans TaxID=415747 RepID=A0A1G5R362_9GAMM|nr:HupE/UreJ family protein [Thiohalomonas denitrificans]SCZ67891.1 HupE / UreJ protein [Thiohalomonas denitrificans]
MKKYLFGLIGLLFASNAVAHGMSASDKQRILDAGLMEYIELGASHMLTGYDHLLFLFGVIFFLTRFNDIIKFITAFTLGHSITLIFATLYGIQANYYLVDAVIALTVCYKAFENLDGFKRYLNSRSPNLTWMVLGFGLIHGFGLSTRLQQLPLGDEGIVMKIIAFNVGVEVGQIAALAIMLFLLSGWRKTESFSRFSRASNIGLMLTGGLLLMMQLHGYQHTTFTEEFPLNRDDHSHVHEDMQAATLPAALESYQQPISLKPKATETTDTEPAPAAAPSTHSHEGGTPHTH